jgi:tRNA pseudouridine13 synthase
MITAAPRLEAEIGIGVYASEGRGVGGIIRQRSEDFVVEELLVDGSKASVETVKEASLPSGNGRYLVCVLVKKDWDTLVAVKEIANRIGISPERVNIAGIKDTNALTAQHISLGGVSPRKANVDIAGISLRPIRFSNEEVSSRLLFGNQFAITVKAIRYAPSTVHRRLEKTKNELADLGGVPNFFGHQRFGTVRPITHKVGCRIVKGDYENAVLTFLAQPSSHEHPEARKARKQLQDTGDFRLALRHFPKSLMYERLMLVHLSMHPRDFLGALRRLPPKLCSLFVQAHQSFLFNRFLTERMKQGFPLYEALPGDYVANLDEKGLTYGDFSKIESHNATETNEKIRLKKMALAIPLVGFKQPCSEGTEGEIEKEILEEEETNPQDFRIPKMPESSAPGGLRTALAPVIDLNIEEDAQADACGLSIKFSFTLHKSSYATVLLREFMKPKDLIKAGY